MLVTSEKRLQKMDFGLKLWSKNQRIKHHKKFFFQQGALPKIDLFVLRAALAYL